MSPFAPLNCAPLTHAVGASTRMRRALWQHVLAVGETAPDFPTTIPFYNCSVTNYGSIPTSARDNSRVIEHRTRYFALRTVNNSFALVHWESPANNVDAETILGNLQFEYDSSCLAVPKGVARPTGPLRSSAVKGFRHYAQIFFPWPVEVERVSQTLSPYNALGRRPSVQPRTQYCRWCFVMRTRH